MLIDLIYIGLMVKEPSCHAYIASRSGCHERGISIPRKAGIWFAIRHGSHVRLMREKGYDNLCLVI